MSSGAKVPLAWARSAAEKLPGFWGVDPAGISIVGSIRRQRPEVGDVELLAPMPAAGQRDELYFAIERTVGPAPREGLLFQGGVASGKHGWAVRGLTAGFRTCSLVLTFANAGHDPAKPEQIRMQVEVYRYDPGPAGNRGWIELGRTGPRELGAAFLGHWKRRWRCPGEGSIKGYLRDGRGEPVATPTEAEAFALAGLEHIPPERRFGGESLIPLRGVGVAT